MKTSAILCAVLALGMSSVASARLVTFQKEGKHGTVRAQVNQNLAQGIKTDLRTMQRIGADAYLNLWQKSSRASRASLPMGSGAIMVTRVNNGTQAYNRWVSEYAKNTIGFMSTGNPQYPGGTGNLRVGDKFYSYSAVRGEGSVKDMRNMREAHVESTFKVTTAEMKAFKAFHLARHNGLVQKDGRTLLPEFDSHHASNLTIEGCAGASTSAMDPKGWLKYFERSLPHIQARGRAMGIPELTNANASMVQAIKGFMDRYKVDLNGQPYHCVKQNTAPKSLVRIFGVYGGRITILNSPTTDQGRNQFAQNVIKQKWDQTHANHDQDKGWNGMGGKSGVHVLPDRAVGTAFKNDRKSSSFTNVRMNIGEALQLLGGGSNPPAPGLLNVNQATATQLQGLHGIGSVKAGRIIQDRQRNGAYSSLQDLTRVKGIGSSTVNRLSSFLTVQ